MQQARKTGGEHDGRNYEHAGRSVDRQARQEQGAEVIDFQEASKQARVRKHKEKLLYQERERYGELEPNDARVVLIQCIAGRLQSALPDLKVGTAHYLQSSEINAFALKGDSDVFIYDGLLRQYVTWCQRNNEVPSEDAIAFVLAHEIGHVRQGTQEVDPLGDGEHDHGKEKEKKHSHQEHLNDEYDADRFGLHTMARAGYNPREGLKMLKFLESLSGGLQLPITHPRSADRVRELTTLVESPDTIMQNTDVAITQLGDVLEKSLTQEDPRRPGTALYRRAARENLGAFLRKAETMPDVLEVIRLAQVQRHFDEVDRLRQTENARTAYAKYLVAKNLRGLVRAMETAHIGPGVLENREVGETDVPSGTTRYVVREYGYEESRNEHPSKNLPTDVSALQGLGRYVNAELQDLEKSITGRLQSIARDEQRVKPASKQATDLAALKGKLEDLRARAKAVVEAADHRVLQEFATNASIDPQTDWVNAPATKAWIETSSVDEMLLWCTRDSSIFFSQIAHPKGDQMKKALGKAVGNDDRYQEYLPTELRQQQNIRTAEGRAAFLEESVFQVVNTSLEWMPHGMDRQLYFTRTQLEIERLREDLRVSLSRRYAPMKCAAEVADAIAKALLSDDYRSLSALENVAANVDASDREIWLSSIPSLSGEFCASANALFLGETGLGSHKIGGVKAKVFEQFSRLEKMCTARFQEHAGSDERSSAKALESLCAKLGRDDGDARSETVANIAQLFARQEWSDVDIAKLEDRLSPVFALMNEGERKEVLIGIFGFGNERMPNFPAVLAYSLEASGSYAKILLQNGWEQLLAQTTKDERLQLLQSVYAHGERIPDLDAAYTSDFTHKLGGEYITLAREVGGEPEGIAALEDLVRRRYIQGNEGAPLFGDAKLLEWFDALSVEDVHRIARACKETDPQGTSLNREFVDYVVTRLCKECGVTLGSGRDKFRNITFDTQRPFAEVFAHIGEYVPYWHARALLGDCLNAYNKEPVDTVIEGLESYYEPIPKSAMRVDERIPRPDESIDVLADRYSPTARLFYGRARLVHSERLRAIEGFLEQTDLLHDHAKTAIERMQMIVELIPEKTDYRDQLFGQLEEDFLREQGITTQGHRLMFNFEPQYHNVMATWAYAFYTEALPHMVDQARMQLWGRRADALYREYFVATEHPSLGDELTRIEQLFPAASFARDEALYALGNSTLVQTPEQARRVQALLTEMQRQTREATDLSSQSQLERFNVFMGNLSRSEKKDFVLWTIGAQNSPPKSLRAYGGLNYVSFEEVPALVFAATAQEREQFLLRMFTGSNGLFEPQNPEDEDVLDEFIGDAFDRIFPDHETDGVTGPPREMLRTIFATVLTEYDPYRRGKIFIGMVEALREKQTAGRGEKIAALMNELGPVFIKVGQVLSETERAPGEYLLPEDIRVAMKQLKQSAKRFHRMAALFSLESANEFAKDNPHRVAYVGETIAAASIKQVNEVVCIDGKEAVEKVLRPSIEKHLGEDVRVLKVIVDKLREVTTVPRGIEEIGATYVKEESDFVREVENTKKIAKSLQEYEKRRVIRRMPVRTTEVYSYSKRHIQEEKVHGISLAELEEMADDPAKMDALEKKYKLAPADLTKYVAMIPHLRDIRLQAFDSLAYQYFQADTFHSDPQGGNLKITPDGELVFIDNGSVGETKQTERGSLKKFFLGFALKQPVELKAAMRSLTKGLSEQDVDEVVALVGGSLNDAEKMNRILTLVTERAKGLDPAFDKFLKSFATGAYLMSGLNPEDVRMVLGAYTQGDKGSLRTYAATAVARMAQDKPDSLVGRAVRMVAK